MELDAIFDLNRKNWDERVGVHLPPGGVDLTGLRLETAASMRWRSLNVRNWSARSTASGFCISNATLGLTPWRWRSAAHA